MQGGASKVCLSVLALMDTGEIYFSDSLSLDD